MANSLTSSSSSYHQGTSSKSQCSPNSHDGYRHPFSSSHHRSGHRSSEMQQGNRVKLSSLKGKSWSSFGDVVASESSEYKN